MQPTTSANIATPPSSTSGQTVIRLATKDVRGAPPAIVQPTPGPSTSAVALDPAQLIQATLSTLFQQQQQSNQQIMQTLLQMFAPATTATAETAPPKDEKKSSRKDHHKDRRE